MSVYAIQNKRTKEFVYGTDYRYGKPAHQFTEPEVGLLFTSRFDAELTMEGRRCGKSYEVVEVKPLEVLEGSE